MRHTTGAQGIVVEAGKMGPGGSKALAISGVRGCEANAEVGIVDPLEEPGWDAAISTIPGNQFFHHADWARVLHDTYGHRAMYICRIKAGRIAGLLPVMEVCSRWTGTRGVSLPFTDFCTPLGSCSHEIEGLYSFAMEHGRRRGWRFLECRNNRAGWAGASESVGYWGHTIDLGGGAEGLFRRLKGSVRRGIRKAEKAGVRVEFSDSLESMRDFCSLHCMTRKRHGRPCQPFGFFANVLRYMVAERHGFVVVARYQNQPIAAAVYLHQGREAIYKFGASDYAFQRLRANNLVMWQAIERYAATGFERLHLGRTSLSNAGLRRFKLGFGVREERIEYSKYSFAKETFVTEVDRAEGFKFLFKYLPPSLLKLAGRILYPHLA